jgi:hypothetical protein
LPKKAEFKALIAEHLAQRRCSPSGGLCRRLAGGRRITTISRGAEQGSQMSVAASKLLDFPNPVNEYAARSVAAMVVLLCAATLVFQTPWLLWALALGFLARVASGPRFSLFGQLATKVIAPRIGPAKLVPGPPKRFAQAIGATLSMAAVIAFYLGAPTLSWVLVGLITVAALLESVFGYCLGCAIFGRLQAIGLIPASVCEACNNVSLRYQAPTAG